jgi:uncharacterized membrane protein
MFLPLPPISWRQLHPILVHFTAALVPVSIAADMLGKAVRGRSLSDVGWWTLLLAAAITPLTATTGWWLRLSTEQAPAEPGAVMAFHQWLGSGLVVLLIGLCSWRGVVYRRRASPGWLYLICGSSIVLLTAYQGHLGGSMSFG